MTRKEVRLVPKVGYVHTLIFSKDESFWSSWISARSQRHAERMAGKLGWYEQHGSPGKFTRSVWYDRKSKRLETRAGYDV